MTDPNSENRVADEVSANSDLDFQNLIKEARDGSDEALADLIRSCRDYLLLAANQQLGSHLQGKLGPSDLVQSACLLAQQNIGQFRGDSKAELLAWLRQIIRNEVHAAHRRYGADKRDVDREVSPTTPSGGNALDVPDEAHRTPSSDAIIHEEGLALRRALTRLSADHRQVVVLRNWERLTFEEVGDRMNRSADAAKKLWSRAIQQLKKELNDESQGPQT